VTTAAGDRVVDLDGHVFEPDELWDEHLAPEWRERRPRLVRDNRGTTRYMIEGKLVPAGEGRGAWVPEGVMESACLRPGGVDPKPRLADMDTEGIDVAVLYGTVSLGFHGLQDGAFAAACCHAYNDWLASYCSTDPDRLKGVPVLALQAPDAACAEAERAVGELGFVSLTLPCALGPRALDDPFFDRFYALAQDLDVPIGFHAGGGRFTYDRFVDAYATQHALEFPFNVMFATASLLAGGVLERFPRLRVALLEAGAGWLPYFLERLDEHWEKRRGEMRATRRPSEVLDEGRLVVSCEPEEATLGMVADLVGPQVVAYASDYPHWDAEFPRSVAAIATRPELPDVLKAAILGANAHRILGW
jgi:predicted TIM-barrel fold metal-dependent hydrolase